MTGLEPVVVSHHQFQVITSHEVGDLPLYTVGDDFVQLVGTGTLTAFTGVHTGRVAIQAAGVKQSPERPDPADWDIASEATLWCPEGRILICGLMGDCPEPLQDVAGGAPGLYRVQVRGRGRRPEAHSGSDEPPTEFYQVLAWPVAEDTPIRTLLVDDLAAAVWTPAPARGGEWAMIGLTADSRIDPRRANLRAQAAKRRGAVPEPDRRADVIRTRPLSRHPDANLLTGLAAWLGDAEDGNDVILSAGELEVRISPARPPAADGHSATFTWRWSPRPGSSAAVPDSQLSTVELRLAPHPDDDGVELSVAHRGVRARDAVHLGLIWDHLLVRAQQWAEGADLPPNPWLAWFEAFERQAEQAAAEAIRIRDRRESLRWGGRPPTGRLRDLRANTRGLARLDRDLLDALAEASPEVQRDVARWAARQACTVAGLAEIDWIAAALDALDRGAAPPPPFDDSGQMWERLWSDDRVPHTVITLPTGTENCLQQAAALPSVRAAVAPDPLAAAVDALHAAAYAHGVNHPELLAAARRGFPALDRRRD